MGDPVSQPRFRRAVMTDRAKTVGFRKTNCLCFLHSYVVDLSAAGNSDSERQGISGLSWRKHRQPDVFHRWCLWLALYRLSCTGWTCIRSTGTRTQPGAAGCRWSGIRLPDTVWRWKRASSAPPAPHHIGGTTHHGNGGYDLPHWSCTTTTWPHRLVHLVQGTGQRAGRIALQASL